MGIGEGLDNTLVVSTRTLALTLIPTLALTLTLAPDSRL